MCSNTNINKNQHKHSFDYSYLMIQNFTNCDYFFRHSERYYTTFRCEFSKTFYAKRSHIHGSVIQKLHWFKSKIKELRQKFFSKSSKRQIFKYPKYKNFVEIIPIFWTDLRSFRAPVSILQLIIIRNLISLYHFGNNAEYDLLSGQKRTFHSEKIPVCNSSLLVISTRDCREAELAWNDPQTRVSGGHFTQNLASNPVLPA